MSTEDQVQDSVATDVVDGPKPPAETRKRPRLDLSALGVGGQTTRERKRGKSMFGIVLGTLNKAKIEDKERNASEAAKKRHLIEKRLQTKLRKETDSVRRQEEAKKSKNTANRREEDVQLKDSICKLRRIRHSHLVNFLLTSDKIPLHEDDEDHDLDDTPPPPRSATISSLANPLSLPPRSHPPPLYYLPAKLTPAQEAFLTRRKREVKEAVEKEWEIFKDERTLGIEEINQLRLQVVEEESKLKSERAEAGDLDAEMDADAPGTSPTTTKVDEKGDVDMDVDDDAAPAAAAPVAESKKATETEENNSRSRSHSAKNADSVPVQADDDDAVEY